MPGLPNYERDLGAPYHPPGYGPGQPLTPGFRHHFGYGGIFADDEEYALHQQLELVPWHNDDANGFNWCHPGKEWW
jgi:hypothetical protein